MCTSGILPGAPSVPLGCLPTPSLFSICCHCPAAGGGFRSVAVFGRSVVTVTATAEVTAGVGATAVLGRLSHCLSLSSSGWRQSYYGPLQSLVVGRLSLSSGWKSGLVWSSASAGAGGAGHCGSRSAPTVCHCPAAAGGSLVTGHWGTAVSAFWLSWPAASVWCSISTARTAGYRKQYVQLVHVPYILYIVLDLDYVAESARKSS